MIVKEEEVEEEEEDEEGEESKDLIDETTSINQPFYHAIVRGFPSCHGFCSHLQCLAVAK